MVDKIEESSEYDNCVNFKDTESSPGSLVDFIPELSEIDDSKEWKQHWVGMPEFTQENNPPYKQIIISFRTKQDYDDFANIIDQQLTPKTKSIWHPRLDKDANTLKRWIEE